MKTISIRELHLETGRWVRYAARRGPVVVTDRGQPIAVLQPCDAATTGRQLPNREAAIRRQSKIPVDSAVYQADFRDDRGVTRPTRRTLVPFRPITSRGGSVTAALVEDRDDRF